MRIFGSDRITKVVDSMGMKEDEALQATMLSNAIERAQKRLKRTTSAYERDLWTMMTL